MSKTSSPFPKPAPSKARKIDDSPAEKPAPSHAEKIDAGKIDPRLVREIANLLSDSDLTEIEVEKGDLRIRVARQNAVLSPSSGFAPSFAPSFAPAYPAPPAPGPAHAETAAPAEAHAAADVLKSPMVGTVYLRPSPDAKAFIEIGAHVTTGQKVLLVEAMKTFNDIVAHKSGAVTALLVKTGSPSNMVSRCW